MLCYRAVDTTADEEGGGRDEEYEINSMAGTSEDREKGMVATLSQHTKTIPMNNQGNNIMRNVITQLTGNLTDAGFTALVTAYNLPAGLTLGAAQAIVKGTMQAVMQNCYDDVQSRALSKREVVKHNMVFDIAERTYFELAANDKGNVLSQDVVLEDSYFQQVYETAEHMSIEAIRQSERGS